jgi:hypothetical protein
VTNLKNYLTVEIEKPYPVEVVKKLEIPVPKPYPVHLINYKHISEDDPPQKPYKYVERNDKKFKKMLENLDYASLKKFSKKYFQKLKASRENIDYQDVKRLNFRIESLK